MGLLDGGKQSDGASTTIDQPRTEAGEFALA